MKEELLELYKHRDLLYVIVCRDIKVRYKQSVMGFLWAILMPSLIVMSGIIVRFGFAVASGRHLQVMDISSVAVKSLPWSFLVSSIRFSGNSLLGNRELVTKIYFPKEIFPIAAVSASLFDACVASIGLIILLFALHTGFTIGLLWVPLLVLNLVVLATGVAMFVSAASLFFRDVKYIVEVFLTFGIFFTPVFYNVGMFGPAGKWLLLNPVGPILEGLSAAVTGQAPPEMVWFWYSAAFAAASLYGGYLFFKHLEPAFAESI